MPGGFEGAITRDNGSDAEGRGPARRGLEAEGLLGPAVLRRVFVEPIPGHSIEASG